MKNQRKVTVKNSIINDTAWCSACQERHSIDQFWRSSSNPNGYRKTCKAAFAAYRVKTGVSAKEYKDAFRKKQSGTWIVYELPSGYIGETEFIRNRMSKHATKGNTPNKEVYTILCTTHCGEEALDIEALYQSQSEYYNFTPDNKGRLKSINK